MPTANLLVMNKALVFSLNPGGCACGVPVQAYSTRQNELTTHLVWLFFSIVSGKLFDEFHLCIRICNSKTALYM